PARRFRWGDVQRGARHRLGPAVHIEDGFNRGHPHHAIPGALTQPGDLIRAHASPLGVRIHVSSPEEESTPRLADGSGGAIRGNTEAAPCVCNKLYLLCAQLIISKRRAYLML